MSSRIMQVRSEDIDRRWIEKARETLREMAKSGPKEKIIPRWSLLHAGRTRDINLDDPVNPIINAPGAPRSQFTTGCIIQMAST
jgi:hypothetical protein